MSRTSLQPMIRDAVLAFSPEAAQAKTAPLGMGPPVEEPVRGIHPEPTEAERSGCPVGGVRSNSRRCGQGGTPHAVDNQVMVRAH